jgi:hypothetical protein
MFHKKGESLFYLDNSLTVHSVAVAEDEVQGDKGLIYIQHASGTREYVSSFHLFRTKVVADMAAYYRRK